MKLPFYAPNQVQNIIQAFIDKGWTDSDTVAAGTLTQTVSKRPFTTYLTWMICEMVIQGVDTDADDAEAVTFAETFQNTPMIFCVDANATGFQLTVAGTKSTTGFQYENEGAMNNLGVEWYAMGAKLIAL